MFIDQTAYNEYESNNLDDYDNQLNSFECAECVNGVISDENWHMDCPACDGFGIVDVRRDSTLRHIPAR